MPKKGWFILTVREATAERVKQMAHAKGLTVDEFINELMSPSGKTGWSACPLCGAKVKFKNPHEHLAIVHSKYETSQNID